MLADWLALCFGVRRFTSTPFDRYVGIVEKIASYALRQCLSRHESGRNCRSPRGSKIITVRNLRLGRRPSFQPSG